MIPNNSMTVEKMRLAVRTGVPQLLGVLPNTAHIIAMPNGGVRNVVGNENIQRVLAEIDQEKAEQNKDG